MTAGVSAKGFKALLVTQLFGALNDNLFKVFISLLAIDLSLQNAGVGRGYFILSGVSFVIPYLVFAPLCGSCSDKFSKTRVIQTAKLFEVIIFILMFFFLKSGYFPGLLFGLFLLGTHSAFYSPSKYGILPEILNSEYLSRGNGLLEMTVFLGSITGTGLAGLIMSLGSSGYIVLSLCLLTFSIIGFSASLLINSTSAANSTAKLEINPFKTLTILNQIKNEKALFLILFSSAYFWGLAAFYQQNIQLFAKELAKLNNFYTSILLTALGLGIGLGSMFAGKVSKGRAELGLVPIGAMGIAISSILLSQSYNYYYLALFFVITLGVSSGFYIVPQNAYFQEHSKKEVRGSFLAASNFLAYTSMLLSYGFLYFALEVLNFNASHQQIVIALFTGCITIIACKLLPAVTLRAVNWIIIHSLYKVRILGSENIPSQGGALIICNHVGYSDPPIIMASCKRLVRFLIYRPIYHTPIVHQIAKYCKAIPIDENDTPKQILKSLNEAREAIRNGELVCIFAEGELSRIGHLLSFKKGFERIIKGLDAPIIPMYIDQIWGSVFSNRNGKFHWKMPKQIPYPITIKFGEPLPPTTKAIEVRQNLLEMIADVHQQRKERYPTLHQSAISVMKKRLFAIAAMDSSGRKISNLKLAIASVALANVFNNKFLNEKYLGLMLPPSIAGLLSNLSLSMSNQIPVNLNYTAGEDAINQAIAKCQIKNIITSRIFLEKQPIKTTANFIFIEDVIKEIQLSHKIMAIIKLILPTKYLFPKTKEQTNLATIIFSSGSTAEPKGVMLTQTNIKANIESIYELFNLSPNDGILGVLPFFHSFGYTATVWLPLLCSLKAVYHFNPFDATKVGELISKEQIKILISTPTLLLAYIRKCRREQLRSLVYVITGAEKLKERIAQSFYEKFGIYPMEGYGCTELSPVATLNVPNYKDSVISQIGHKPGTVGHPIPGVAARIVDIDTLAILPPDIEGLLQIKGPNVMLGYLEDQEKTDKVIANGWYNTGDVARIDEDGFITITDRLSRFSKIAGEMVPHQKIEEAIHTVLGEKETICAVTSVEDESRGEKLAVLITREFDYSELGKKLQGLGLPNLWIPKTENYFLVSELPLLGTGKLDLKEIKRKVIELSALPKVSVD